MELNELRKIVEAATPGPWEVWKNVHCDPVVVPAEKPWAGITDPKMPFEKIAGLSTAPDDYGRANLEYIATFDPPTVLALLSRLEQAEQALARVRSLCMTTDGDLICPDFDGNTVGDILRALDGDGRRLADDALGGGQHG